MKRVILVDISTALLYLGVLIDGEDSLMTAMNVVNVTNVRACSYPLVLLVESSDCISGLWLF